MAWLVLCILVSASLVLLLASTRISTKHKRRKASCRSQEFKPMSAGDWCFCLYAGSCLDHFGIDVRYANNTDYMRRMQLEKCGSTTEDLNEHAASFYSRDDEKDLLSIPVPHFFSLSQLASECPEGALAVLTAVVESGRKVFTSGPVGGKGTPPEFQCAHLPGSQSIGWLHVHSFIGKVAGDIEFNDAMPGIPPITVCVEVKTMSAAEAARSMLAQANVCMAVSVDRNVDPRVSTALPSHAVCKENLGVTWNPPTFAHGRDCHVLCPDEFEAKPAVLRCANQGPGAELMSYTCVEKTSTGVATGS